MSAPKGYTVSGPGVDREGLPAPAVALSFAITCASRATEEATYYVRDSLGEACGRAERDEVGIIRIYGQAPR